MAFLSGERLSAARLNRIQPTTYYAQASTFLALSTTYADVPGATVTFSTIADFATIVVDAEFDSAVGSFDTATEMNGRIMVDGVAGSALSKHQMDTVDRSSVFTQEQFTLAAAGSHTVKLQGAKSAAGGSGNMQVFTSIKVTVYEVP